MLDVGEEYAKKALFKRKWKYFSPSSELGFSDFFFFFALINMH